MRTTHRGIVVRPRVLPVVALVMFTALLPQSARGQDLWSDKSGAGMSWGLGTSVAGTQGLIVHRFYSPDFGFQGVFGLSNLSATANASGGGEVKNARRTITFGGYAVKKARDWDHGTLNWLGGFELRLQSGERVGPTAPYKESSMDIALGAGLMTDWFLGDRFALFFQTGVSYVIRGANSTRDLTFFGTGDLSGSSIQVGSTSIGAMMGFSWWPEKSGGM